MRFRDAVLFSAVFAAVLLACDRAPSADGLKEWGPGDHDRMEDNARIARGAQPGGPGGQQNAEQLIEATWRAQCATCHGVTGKGDGPQAAMFKPADLTREDWQAKVTDPEMAAVIKNGKGKMPAFSQIPDAMVQGLVMRIRFHRGQ
jgi:cytochrome c oxidase cbb3-type subunit 3